MGEKIKSKHFMNLKRTQCILLYILNVVTNTQHASHTIMQYNDSRQTFENEVDSKRNSNVSMVGVRYTGVLCFPVCRCF